MEHTVEEERHGRRERVTRVVPPSVIHRYQRGKGKRVILLAHGVRMHETMRLQTRHTEGVNERESQNERRRHLKRKIHRNIHA